MKAAIYARFSTDKQKDDSIEDQGRNCVAYADRAEWQVIQRFGDRALSGASKDRPGYKAMLAAAEAKAFDILLVDDLSRLSRDEVEMKQVIRRFKFRGIRIIGVSDGYDSDSKGQKIQSTMRGLMNEIYLDDLREKTHRGLSGKVLNGYSAGGRTYGYRRAPIENLNKLDADGRPEIEAVERVINEDEAQSVRQIYEWFAGGWSPKRIAAELNRLGIPSPRRSTWAASAIYGNRRTGVGILNNPLYEGRYVWNRSAWVKDPDTGKRQRLARPETEWLAKDMPELRIVPSELWDAVQDRLEDIRANSDTIRRALDNPASRSHAGKYMFSGLLKCGCCGANYTMHSTTSYGCAINLNRGDAACPNRMRVPRRVVEERLLGAIQSQLFTDEAIDLFVKETTELLRQAKAQERPELEAARKQLGAVEGEIENLMTAIKAGIITPSTKVALERAEAERERLQGEVASVSVIADKLATMLPGAIERYKALVSHLQPTLNRDAPVARQHLQALVGTVKLVPVPEGHLVATVQRSFEGLISLATGSKLRVNWLVGGGDTALDAAEGEAFKARLVAGAGFEPAAFRL